ncbi:hypothetical protein CONLIGDRAFT_208405 [Coniochaeta ligniaria NRRL 30616]|uniref:HTH CENPB-type domain-containing protein n=1 Tax=Coniochaeta ligniaria NRRL 30616 TaxID=1408157 RepID=A0A1J7JL29_9PEZI|nr:hypothetical protein CONLIGDRAFT_208405 [Coniochaeta ligniaria NRRL 30616]
MHNQILGASDQESHTGQDNNTYGNDGSWVDMHGFHNHHQTTMPEYNGASFSFMPSISHGLPSESLNRMPPPPPPHSMAQTQTSLPQLPPQLPMLVMPSHATWPSMLTNPHSYSSHSAPAMSTPPIQVTPRVQATLKTKLPALHTQPVPRKTLTDDDRKRMCQYAEEHPHAKQTDIGARFGVERSTVSKVLRNKEKYLYPEQKDSAASSPVKRKPKGGVDIERALTNYVRNAQKSGVTVTDADIKEKARLFSATMGKSDDGLIKTSSSSWLEKFKQKNGIGHGRLMRRASETNIPDSIRGSPSLSASQPSSAISPNSLSGHLSPSPLSANRSEDGKENMNHFMDFNTEPGAYKHSNSQSTTSLSSAFTDGGGSSFSGSALSPSATPFTFSPDSNVGAFLDHSRQLPGGVGSNFQRPRSQTFPTLDLEYMNQQQNTEPLTPRYHVSSTAPSSALESPANEIPQPTYGMDQAISSPQLRHSSSNNSLTGRSTATSAVASSPNSPTQEDARRAADTLLSFISHVGGFVDQSEYMTVVRLTEKLRLHMSQMGKGAGQQGMGGLDRIPEQDSEMSNASPDALGIKAE